MKPSNKWRKTAEAYKFFARNHPMVDFSEESALKMYQSESLGGQYKFPYYDLNNGSYNGYAVGKHLMDMHLKMWREDIRDCYLLKRELFDDPELEPIKEFLLEQFDY